MQAKRLILDTTNDQTIQNLNSVTKKKLKINKKLEHFCNQKYINIY